MRATFKTQNPDAVEVGLTLVASVAEWKRLKLALETGGPEARELALGVAKLITQSVETLATERWTTGYAAGVVPAEAAKAQGAEA